MKSWFSLTLVCWALLCLLLSLSLQAGLNHHLQVAGSSQWLDRCREPASGSPTASVVGSTEFDPARAGPLASLALDGAWGAGNIGPPGQETHGPPQSMEPWQVAVQSRQLEATFKPLCSTKLLTQPTEFEEYRGFGIFLDFPIYRTNRSWRQPISVLKCSCNIIPSRFWRNLFR